MYTLLTWGLKMAGVICCPKKFGEETEDTEEMLPETGF